MWRKLAQKDSFFLRLRDDDKKAATTKKKKINRNSLARSLRRFKDGEGKKTTFVCLDTEPAL